MFYRSPNNTFCPERQHMSFRNPGRLLVFALGLGLIAVTDSRAAGKKAASPFATQITALHAARTTLAQADHDYKGHRVKAMHQVHQAVLALKNGAKAPRTR